MVHLYFNIIGTVVFMVLFYTVNAVVGFSFLGTATNAAGIAVIHSLFNVFATMLLLPFGKGLEKLACLTIRDDVQPAEVEEERKELQLLDSRFLEKPAFAMPEGLDENEQKIVRLVAEGMHSLEELVECCGLPAPRLMCMVTTLEMEGVLERDAANVRLAGQE